jgi:hypothetical protein
MGKVTKICPLRLYITQTSRKLSAVHRYLIAWISNTYFMWNGRSVRVFERTKCDVFARESSISIWKIVTSHKLLRNKAIFIEKKLYNEKLSLKNNKLAHVLCMRFVLHFSHCMFLTFGFIILKYGDTS